LDATSATNDLMNLSIVLSNMLKMVLIHGKELLMLLVVLLNHPNVHGHWWISSSLMANGNMSPTKLNCLSLTHPTTLL
jgi:hypothetical protein